MATDQNQHGRHAFPTGRFDAHMAFPGIVLFAQVSLGHKFRSQVSLWMCRFDHSLDTHIAAMWYPSQRLGLNTFDMTGLV